MIGFAFRAEGAFFTDDMPAIRKTARPRRTTGAKKRAQAASSLALLVIDHQRLQAEAWEKVRAARKRLGHASRALHRHEEVDVPAYGRWLHHTFPSLLNQIRELQYALAATMRKIRAAKAHAFHHGGSMKRIWREQREREAHPDRFADGGREPEPDESETGRRKHVTLEDFQRASAPPPSTDARAIYRRLVQRLHPDRGGDWNEARERLWHEVQQAWHAGDVDWLARLEADWETRNDLLGPDSPLSRLRRAIDELDASRRDIERKLGEYRHDPAWRFTQSPDHPMLQRRVQHRLRHDLKALQDQLEHLNRTIASWEEDWTRADQRVRSPRRRY